MTQMFNLSDKDLKKFITMTHELKLINLNINRKKFAAEKQKLKSQVPNGNVITEKCNI